MSGAGRSGRAKGGTELPAKRPEESQVETRELVLRIETTRERD